MNSAFKQYKPEDVYITILKRKPAEGESATATENDTAQFHPTNTPFLDIFIENLHKYQFQSVLFYAQRLGIETRDFSYAIRALTGMNPTEWRDRYVILSACELLLKTNMSITAISKRLGFDQVSIFSRHFASHTRLRPKVWRKRHKSLNVSRETAVRSVSVSF